MDQQGKSKSDAIQDIMSESLFEQNPSIADLKQIINELQDKAQNLREPQIKALLLLQRLGENKYLHEKNPYKDIIKNIEDKYKISVAEPSYYLDVINETVPKPPKPVIVAPDGKVVNQGRR